MHKKLLVFLLLSIIASLTILGAAKHYLSWKELSIPFFLVYSKDSNFSDADKANMRNRFGLDTADGNLHELDEGDIPIIKEMPSLLTKLDNASESYFQNRHFYKLDAPYSSSEKKELRHQIEKSFGGQSRRKALRSIVFVLDINAFSGDTAHAQFLDELIYAKDNYGGVGLFLSEDVKTELSDFGQAIQEILLTRDAFFY